MTMLCPVCKNIELTMAERQGIEIDYCPACRGVWLDRGELDKIIERSIRGEPAAIGPTSLAANSPMPGIGLQHGHDHHYARHASDHHGQRRSFWKDLFD
jgi:Zn-finger nucleic acid-binding protein